jgi:hypothetical protein
MPPKKQRELLLAAGTDPELPAKLEALAQRRADIEEERRPHILAKQRAERTPPPAGERPKPVDVGEVMEQLKGLRGQEDERRRRERLMEEAQREAHRARERVAELAAALDEARTKVEAAEAADAAARETFLATPDPGELIRGLETRLGEADAVNVSLEPWREYDRVQAEAMVARKTIGAAAEQLAEITATEQSLLAGAGIPAEGLSFDPETGDPLLNERSLAVASGREKAELSVDLAFALNRDLRVALLDEANDLDATGLEAMHNRAVAKGFQIWACRIHDEGPGVTILISDGEGRIQEWGE